MEKERWTCKRKGTAYSLPLKRKIGSCRFVTVATQLHRRHLAVTHLWRQTFWKTPFGLKPFIWRLCNHLPRLHLPSLLLSPQTVRISWHCVNTHSPNICSNTFLKCANWTVLSSRTGIPRSSLAVRSTQCILGALEAYIVAVFITNFCVNTTNVSNIVKHARQRPI